MTWLKKKATTRKATKKRSTKKKAVKKTATKNVVKRQADWELVTQATWFVYWQDMYDDNHGQDLIFGSFKSRAAAESYIENDYADNQSPFIGSTLFKKTPRITEGNLRGIGIDVDHFASGKNPVSKMPINDPNPGGNADRANFEKHQGTSRYSREFLLKEITNKPQIDLVKKKLVYVTD